MTALAIDIGGTKFAVAVVHPDGTYDPAGGAAGGT